MNSIALTQMSAAEAEWAKNQAARELRAAVDALDDARASLRGLADDTAWQSDGVRAMHDALADYGRRTHAEASDTQGRVHEVAGIDVS
ncbi:hypothetical protein [Microbacterium sp. UFMG61]|uniref:hypothetical protein n=1 Tax=Microbacterium sp. UFMG61 TaxID=2745935 RepID=UPI0018906F8B|nr:hypothetical protein [Microbacterium sp. UFMG61]